jgi:hypothetical protein
MLLPAPLRLLPVPLPPCKALLLPLPALLPLPRRPSASNPASGSGLALAGLADW